MHHEYHEAFSSGHFYVSERLYFSNILYLSRTNFEEIAIHLNSHATLISLIMKFPLLTIIIFHLFIY